jgi:hypothetical protein
VIHFNILSISDLLFINLAATVAICVGWDFEAPTYQTATNFDKSTEV